MKEGGRASLGFNNILDMRAAVWMKRPRLLPVFIRESEITLFSCDIIFCPALFLHGMRLLATVHANQKFWFMHLSRSEWNIKFNFAAVELRLHRAQADTVNRACRRRAGIHYFLHNMRKQHLNETFVSCQIRVASTLSIQIHKSVEEGSGRSDSTVTKQWVA